MGLAPFSRRETGREANVEDVLGGLKSVHARVIERLESTPFEELLKPRFPEHSDSPPLLGYVLGNTSGHFEEHRENIEKALAGGELG
jgi:hypothetical protein